jgi:hypothetical protein
MRCLLTLASVRSLRSALPFASLRPRYTPFASQTGYTDCQIMALRIVAPLGGAASLQTAIQAIGRLFRLLETAKPTAQNPRLAPALAALLRFVAALGLSLPLAVSPIRFNRGFLFRPTGSLRTCSARPRALALLQKPRSKTPVSPRVFSIGPSASLRTVFACPCALAFTSKTKIKNPGIPKGFLHRPSCLPPDRLRLSARSGFHFKNQRFSHALYSAFLCLLRNSAVKGLNDGYITCPL